MGEFAQTFGTILLVVFLVALVLAATLLALAWHRLRRVRLEADAGFLTTLRAVPLDLVVALDLLDLALDFLAAPITWVVLGRFGLRGLREVATLQSLVPLTQPLPLLTLCWLATRLLKLGETPSTSGGEVIETEPVGPGRYAARNPNASSR